MGKQQLLAVAVIASLWGGYANAAAQCEGPQQDGNTWNLICAADGSGESEYQCDYFLALTNAQGLSETVEATGSVSPGQSGVIIWSAIQNQNADITAASMVRGTCSL
ncbi:MAG: hypothetical protein K2Y25_05645 [Pseudomonadaceae bacterium]|jgi:hypothetical protein|nr:hypothetical protein [Pseudomonadaceae bacterium]